MARETLLVGRDGLPGQRALVHRLPGVRNLGKYLVVAVANDVPAAEEVVFAPAPADFQVAHFPVEHGQRSRCVVKQEAQSFLAHVEQRLGVLARRNVARNAEDAERSAQLVAQRTLGGEEDFHALRRIEYFFAGFGLTRLHHASARGHQHLGLVGREEVPVVVSERFLLGLADEAAGCRIEEQVTSFAVLGKDRVARCVGNRHQHWRRLLSLAFEGEFALMRGDELTNEASHEKVEEQGRDRDEGPALRHAHALERRLVGKEQPHCLVGQEYPQPGEEGIRHDD